MRFTIPVPLLRMAMAFAEAPSQSNKLNGRGLCVRLVQNQWRGDREKKQPMVELFTTDGRNTCHIIYHDEDEWNSTWTSGHEYTLLWPRDLVNRKLRSSLAGKRVYLDCDEHDSFAGFSPEDCDYSLRGDTDSQRRVFSMNEQVRKNLWNLGLYGVEEMVGKVAVRYPIEFFRMIDVSRYKLQDWLGSVALETKEYVHLCVCNNYTELLQTHACIACYPVMKDCYGLGNSCWIGCAAASYPLK